MKSILRNLFRHLTYQAFSPGALLRETYESFKDILMRNKTCLELMAEIETIYHDRRKVDLSRVQNLCARLSSEVSAMVEQLNRMSPITYAELPAYCRKITFYLMIALETMRYDIRPPYVLSLDDIPRDGESVAGGKAWRLSLIRRELGLPVPDGFVVTASACRYFIEANDLKRAIDTELAGIDLSDPGKLEWTASRLAAIISRVPVPVPLAREIWEAANVLAAGDEHMRFAVRSSAVGEDGSLSFAGQHQSVLNVDLDGLVSAYKQVIAGKYSHRALAYRIGNGLIDVDMPMAVLCLPMLDAASAGVVYTADPTASQSPTIAIHAVRGLGEALVSGMVSPQRYDMTRDEIPRCIHETPVLQRIKTIAGQEGMLETVTVSDADDEVPCLHADELVMLTQWALRLETYFCGPLDIEWCRDARSGLMLLQARPLHVMPEADSRNRPEVPEGAALLVEGGSRAAGGYASGPAFLLTLGRSFDQVPQGAVLIAAVASPDLSRITGRLAAAVFEVGSPAGHFASIARESGLPTIVQAEGALSQIHEGQMVTVDADRLRVYEGAYADLSGSRDAYEDPFLASPFRLKLRKALDLISPLNLTDPGAAGFAPAGCRTVHDIIRFCHERALYEMFSLNRLGTRASRGARQLKTDLPLVIYLLDISDNSSCCPPGGGGVMIDGIDHAAFRAFWSGLSHPDIEWVSDTLQLDWGMLEQAGSGGIMSLSSPLLASFAILAHDYINLSIRFGYHFAVIDSLCSAGDEESYVLFSFKGGGGSHDGLLLRVAFIDQVMSHYGFRVTVRGDTVEADLAHRSAQETRTALVMIGTLLGCTRQLDFRLKDARDVSRLVQSFLAGEYDFSKSFRTDRQENPS